MLNNKSDISDISDAFEGPELMDEVITKIKALRSQEAFAGMTVEEIVRLMVTQEEESVK